MWEVDGPDRLARAVRSSHTVTSRVEVWSDGKMLTESAPFLEGSVSNDWVVAGISRSLDLTVPPNRFWMGVFDSPIVEVRPFRGVRYSRASAVECPMGVFPVLPPEMTRPAGPVKIQADDYYQRVQQADFTYPTMSYGYRIVDTLAWLVANAGLPWPLVTSRSQQVAPGVLMDKTRHDAVLSFSKSASVETIIDREGNPTIQDARVLGAPTSEILTGAGQSAVGVAVKPDWSKVFNVVTVTSSAQDVDFPPQIMAITDSQNPAHPSRIGWRVKKWSSPLLMDAESGLKAALTILLRVSGQARSYQYQCLPNPSTDAGDSVLGATMRGTEVSQILNVTTPLTGKGGLQSVTTVSTQLDIPVE